MRGSSVEGLESEFEESGATGITAGKGMLGRGDRWAAGWAEREPFRESGTSVVRSIVGLAECQIEDLGCSWFHDN